MKDRKIMKRALVLFAIAFALLVGNTSARAEQASLNEIMLKLEADMEMIVKAVNYGDLKAVEESAMAIAEHEKIPMVKRLKIAEILKEDMPNFKQTDMAVHDAALKVAESAKGGDYNGVAENYRLLLNGCVSCHLNFRDRVREGTTLK